MPKHLKNICLSQSWGGYGAPQRRLGIADDLYDKVRMKINTPSRMYELVLLPMYRHIREKMDV